MYKIVLTQRALRDLENIDKEMKNGIAAKLREYTREPLKYGQKTSKSIHRDIQT